MKVQIVTNRNEEQPHHVRVVAANGEPILHGENLENIDDAENEIRIVEEYYALLFGLSDGVRKSEIQTPIEYVDETPDE